MLLWSFESLPDEDVALDVVDGEVDALIGHKAEVPEQRVGDLHPGDEGLIRPTWKLRRALQWQLTRESVR